MTGRRDTTEEDTVFKKWLEQDVFPKGEKSCSNVFDISEELFDLLGYEKLLSSNSSKDELNNAVHKAGMLAFLDNEAKCFHVKTYDDNCIVEQLEWYTYSAPLAQIFTLLDSNLGQEGTHYIGLGSAVNKWLLLFDGKMVSIHGNEKFINHVKNNL